MANAAFGGRLIAVGGGKGGVGKSVITSNLGVALAQQGQRVVILDADLGAPNLHSMFGIQLPDTTIGDFIEGRVDSLDDVLVDSGVKNVKLLCGTPQVLGSANPKWQSKLKLIRRLGKLETDVLVIDVGAGVDLNTVDFFNAADIRLIVLTPEITSIQNAYGFLKIALYRRLQRAVAGREASKKLAEAFGGRAFEIGSSMDKMETFLTLVESEAPELAVPFKMLLEEFNAKIIGNMLAKEADRNVVFAVRRMTEQFLGLRTDVCATFSSDPHARDAVNSGEPLMVGGGHTANAQSFTKLAKELLAIDLNKVRALRAAIVKSLAASGGNVRFGLESIEVGSPEERPDKKPPLPPSAGTASAAKVARPAPKAVAANQPPASVAAPVVATDPARATATPAPAQGGVPLPPATPAQPPAPAPPRTPAGLETPAPNSREGQFLDELEEVQRRSERLVVSHYVQINLGGHWNLGTLVEINDAGACVGSIRPSPSWLGKSGKLRLVARGAQVEATPSIGIHVHSANEQTSRLVVRFLDADQARPLADFFRGKLTH